MRNELAADAFPAVTKLVHAIRADSSPGSAFVRVIHHGGHANFSVQAIHWQGNSSDSESAIHQGFCGIHSEISARKAKARRKTRMTQQVTTLATVQQQ
jgi:hypothetical protein